MYRWPKAISQKPRCLSAGFYSLYLQLKPTIWANSYPRKYPTALPASRTSFSGIITSRRKTATGAHRIYEYQVGVISQGVPQHFFGLLRSAILKQKIRVTQQRDAPAEPSPSPKFCIVMKHILSNKHCWITMGNQPHLIKKIDCFMHIVQVHSVPMFLNS